MENNKESWTKRHPVWSYIIGIVLGLLFFIVFIFGDIGTRLNFVLMYSSLLIAHLYFRLEKLGELHNGLIGDIEKGDNEIRGVINDIEKRLKNIEKKLK